MRAALHKMNRWLPGAGPGQPRRGPWGWVGMYHGGQAGGQPVRGWHCPRQSDARFAGDGVAIWQSEFTALAADRETQEAWARWVTAWAAAAEAAAALLPVGHDGVGGARSTAPAGAAAAVAAPDARDAAIERLAGRVAELERIIAGLSGGT